MTASSPLRRDTTATPLSTRRTWLGAASALAVGLLLLAAVFWGEMVAAVRVWMGSTAFNHCFLVLPVALYLAWERRGALQTAPPRPTPSFVLAALPLSLLWFLSERLGIMEGRQLLAMTFVQILFLSVLGLRTWRALSAPLLYLYFLVPFGDSLVPYLQQFTVHFTVMGLDVLRIPNFSTGIAIEIPEGKFLVAEACAGLRFLIASAAFGVFYACVMYTSPLRRLLFITLSLAIPVIANGVRALGIIVLAHFLGSAKAAATDHVLYGWLFFSIVTFALILIGLPFRQPPRQVIPGETRSGRTSVAPTALLAAIGVILLAAVPRALADRLDLPVASEPMTAQMPFSIPSSCVQAPLDAEKLRKFPVSGVTSANSRGYRCPSGFFVVSVKRYPARIGARPLFVEPQAGNAGEALARRHFEVGRGAAAEVWHITEFDDEGGYGAVASALWIDGRPVRSGIRGRIRQALNILRQTPVPPLKAIVVYRARESLAQGRIVIQQFLATTATASNPNGRASAARAESVTAGR